MIVSSIVAVSDNGVIGNKNKIPWNLPEDLQRFKMFTQKNAIIIGRKTFESIGRPLPDRLNIVVSRSGFKASNVIVVSSIEEGLRYAYNKGIKECFIAGGSQIYNDSEKYVSKKYITRVHQVVDGDTFHHVNTEKYTKMVDIKNNGYTFETWIRL